VVRYIAHRIIVLYQGRIAEQGHAETVYANPAHQYTRALLDSAPVPDPDVQQQRRATRRSRAVKNPALDRSDACAFASRCPHAIDTCRTVQPLLEQTPDGTLVACHRWRELRADSTLVSAETQAIQTGG